MNNCPRTEKLRTVLDHLFNGLSCSENIIQTIIHWKNTYWNLAPQDDFECDLLVSHLLSSKIADFIVVMLFIPSLKILKRRIIKAHFLMMQRSLKLTV